MLNLQLQRSLLVIMALLFCQVDLHASIAFIGDSLSTGGAAHPGLKMEQTALISVLRGERSLEPDEAYYETLAAHDLNFTPQAGKPQRLYPTNREFRSPLSWFVENLWMSFGSQYLDSEKYSWAYLLGRNLGYANEQILIAARNGERMEDGVRQLDRVLENTAGQLPEHTFVFFTGNDLCGPRLEYITSSLAYRRHLERLLQYMLKNAKEAGNAKKHVWIIEPLSILQIVTSASILRHQVPYHNKTITCRELQTMPSQFPAFNLPEKADAAELIYPLLTNSPASYCPTLFAVHGEQGSDINVSLANRIMSFREAVRVVSKELAARFREKNIELHSIRQTAQVVFEGEDMANDCFHLNLNGHIKVTKAVLSGLQEEVGMEVKP